jgi:hypothetical protein
MQPLKWKEQPCMERTHHVKANKVIAIYIQPERDISCQNIRV